MTHSVAQELDDAIRSAAEEAMSLATHYPPAHMPRSHFWYYLDPSFVSRC
jgi:hypothetical protein